MTLQNLFDIRDPITPAEAQQLHGLRCISVWQPYASLIALGLKKIETRSRPWKYRGPLLIQAAQKFDGDVKHDCLMAIGAMQVHGHGSLLTEQPYKGSLAWGYNFAECCGKVIAVVNMVDGSAVPHPPDDPIEAKFGLYGAGRYGWRFDAVRRLEEPISVKGSQGVFFAKWDVAGKV